MRAPPPDNREAHNLEAIFQLLLGFLISTAAGGFIYFDASKNGITAESGKRVSPMLAIGAGIWAFLGFLLPIVFVPVYLVVRPKLISKGSTSKAAVSSGLKKCPMCAETIQAQAKLCKHCKSKI